MGGCWANPLQTLPQGVILTFDVDPDPELNNLAKIDHFAHLRPTVTNVFYVCALFTPQKKSICYKERQAI